MTRVISLTAVLVLLSCKGGNPAGDDRTFGSLSASFSSQSKSADGTDSSDAVVEPTDYVIVDEGIDGGSIDNIGKAGTKPADDGNGKGTPPAPGKETPPPVTGKPPVLSDELKGKLAKCYPQWEKDAAGTNYDIRQGKVDVDKLKASNIQLTGDKPEVVFVDISSSSKIEKVKLSLENAKGLYCLDISADKGIEHLDILYVCGAKLGLVDIEGGKAKKVNIKEICDKKP
jgi:hypothetical protein